MQGRCHSTSSGLGSKASVSKSASNLRSDSAVRHTWHMCHEANTLRRKLLHSGFHTPKAVTYHGPTVIWLFMIGHSLGRMETCFGPSTLGAATETHLKSRFCAIFESWHTHAHTDAIAIVHHASFIRSRQPPPIHTALCLLLERQEAGQVW